MPTFALLIANEFDTVRQVHKLVRNGNCLLDQFVKDIEKDNNLEPELGELFAIMEDLANGNLLPKSKYRKLHLSKNLMYSGYECKSKHLRLYTFEERGTGQVIVFGGKKGDQRKDLKRFEKILKDYATN